MDSFEDGVLMYDGAYQELIIEGNTLTNIIPKYSQTDPMEITGTLVTETLEDVFITQGEVGSATIKGRMLYKDTQTNEVVGVFDKTRQLEKVYVVAPIYESRNSYYKFGKGGRL